MQPTQPTAPATWQVKQRWLLTLAGISGAIAVGIGAIGAHSLPKRLAAQGLDPVAIEKKLDQCELAARYQMYHALAVVGLALAPVSQRCRLLRVAAVLFLVGTLGFSGGLYSIVFADQIIHWSIVPLGGTTWIVAWLCVASAAWLPGPEVPRPANAREA
jgi:uncharacterized membrane protein YgdD (TMEM256/DUF423 family)